MKRRMFTEELARLRARNDEYPDDMPATMTAEQAVALLDHIDYLEAEVTRLRGLVREAV